MSADMCSVVPHPPTRSESNAPVIATASVVSVKFLGFSVTLASWGGLSKHGDPPVSVSALLPLEPAPGLW